MLSHSSQVHYLKIGTFVLLGLILLVAGLMIFGAGKLFQPTVYVETYFDESVQGISLGSPVKYRGMQIGYVKKIAFIGEIYPADKDKDGIGDVNNRYIYVQVAITSPYFTHLSKENLERLLQRKIASGLRFKLTTQGLTGIAYLELNFVNPKTHLPLKISWQPKDFYIPSTPSMLTQFTENIQYVFNQLKDIDFKKLFNNINLLAASAQHVSERTDRFLGRVNAPLEITIQNLQVMSNNLRSLSEQMKLYPAQTFLGKAPPPLRLETKN